MSQAGSPQPSDASGASPLDYPANRVIAAVDQVALSAVVPDLIAAGFAPIGILAGEAGLRRLRQTGGSGGGIASLLRRFQMSIGADLDYVTRAQEELADGRALVDVEADGDEAKARARDVFRRHGSHFITYFRPWTIEALS